MIIKSDKNGIKEYVFSLFIDHLFAFMGAMVITNITGFFARKDLSVLNLILCMSLYGVILYSDSWRRGCNDRNRVACGIKKRPLLYGFLVGIIANIPAFCLGIMAFLTECGIIRIYEVFENIDIATTINRLWQLPLSSLFAFVDYPVVNLFVPLFLPVVSGAAYILGSHEIYLKNYILYKKEDSKE